MVELRRTSTTKANLTISSETQESKLNFLEPDFAIQGVKRALRRLRLQSHSMPGQPLAQILLCNSTVYRKHDA